MAREMNEDDPRYIPDDLKETLEAERSMLNPNDTVEQQARKIFGENVAAAACEVRSRWMRRKLAAYASVQGALSYAVSH